MDELVLGQEDPHLGQHLPVVAPFGVVASQQHQFLDRK